MTLHDALHSCTAQLEHCGVDSPRLSAELLLAKALGLDRGALLKSLILEPEALVPKNALRDFAALTARRAAGEPVAYILGYKEFYGREFIVSPDTLIPRPETELLVDLALEYASSAAVYGSASPPRFADFGTGSGCIAITLALELPGWSGLAVEKSPAALCVARENAARLNVAKNLDFALADFTAPPLLPGSLDLLISNPPYISESEYSTISREVRDFEPKSALVPDLGGRRGKGTGGAGQANKAASCPSSGLEDAEDLIELARLLLRPGGLLLMEIGHAQGQALLPCLQAPGWSEARLHKDLAGLDRVISGFKLR